MTAKATVMKFGTGPGNQGNFKAERFNLFDDQDLQKYSDLRNRANDASKGVTIEMIKEYSRKTTTRDGAGEDMTVETTEEIFLLVHYWEKTPERTKGDNNEELKEAKKVWSSEREVG